jgi:hypothetical protein
MAPSGKPASAADLAGERAHREPPGGIERERLAEFDKEPRRPALGESRVDRKQRRRV